MTTNRPAPDSPWGKLCPDAFPEAWFDALGLSSLPSGFARFATDDEAGLIDGRITLGEFTQRSARGPHAPSSPSREEKTRERQSRVRIRQRFRDLSTFLRTVHATLTPTQRAVWLSVYTFSERGRTTVTQATLARIAGVTVRAVQKAMPGLIRKGLLDVLEKGQPGRSSVYRYRMSGDVG